MEKPIDLSNYSDAFKLAYSLVQSHIQVGNADTAALPECLAGLIMVIEKASNAAPANHQPELHK